MSWTTNVHPCSLKKPLCITLPGNFQAKVGWYKNLQSEAIEVILFPSLDMLWLFVDVVPEQGRPEFLLGSFTIPCNGRIFNMKNFVERLRHYKYERVSETLLFHWGEHCVPALTHPSFYPQGKVLGLVPSLKEWGEQMAWTIFSHISPKVHKKLTCTGSVLHNDFRPPPLQI